MAKLKIIFEIDETIDRDPEDVADGVAGGDYDEEIEQILLAEWVEDWRFGGRPEGATRPPRPGRRLLPDGKNWAFVETLPAAKPPAPRPHAEPVHDGPSPSGSPQVAGLLRRVLEHLDAGMPLADELEQTIRKAER